MLLWGTFGTRTLAERRITVRSHVTTAVLVCWTLIGIATRMRPQPAMGLITLLLPGPLFTYYAWEKRKYFLTLDELTRRIELEGMAWAYSIGVLAAVWAGGIAYAISLRWPLSPRVVSWAPFFFFAMLLASIKGGYRYVASRRY
jgi:hypothetical protein